MTIARQFARGALSALLAFAFVLGWTPWAAAQQPPARERKNLVYGELIGAGAGATINYERMVTSRISLRVGGGEGGDPNLHDLTTMGAPDYPDPLAFVAASNIVLAGQRHQLTAGVGVLLLHVRFHYFDEPAPATLFGEVGYRYRSTSGFLFRATLSYFLRDLARNPSGLAPGVSLGWSF